MADAEPRLDIHVAADRGSVTLSLVPADGSAASATFTLEQLTSVIQGLGLGRQHMAFGRPLPPLDGRRVYGVFDTSWCVAPDLRSGGPALLFEHPCFGPVASTMPPEQAVQIARALTLQSQVASRASTAAN